MSASANHYAALLDADVAADVAYREHQNQVNTTLAELDRALGMLGLPPVDRRGDVVLEVARILTQILHLIRNTRRIEN